MAAQPVNVLITGANRGLGLEMVKQILEAFSPVRKLFAGCRDPDGPRAEALRALAKKHPNVITVVRLDADDLNSIKQSAQQVGSMVGTEGLNLLVNNAAYATKSNFMETTPVEMQNCFDTNVKGPLCIMQEYLPLLRAAATASKIPGMSCRKSAVINITSFLASMQLAKDSFQSFPALAYRISKAGLNMLTICAAAELKADGILFGLLHPGWVRTDMGGKEGEIDATESVAGLLRVMASLTEKENGGYVDYKGSTLPW